MLETPRLTRTNSHIYILIEGKNDILSNIVDIRLKFFLMKHFRINTSDICRESRMK